ALPTRASPKMIKRTPWVRFALNVCVEGVRPILARRLYRVADFDHAVCGAWDGAFDQQCVVFRQYADDAEVECRGAVVSELAGHFEAAECSSGCCGVTDRTSTAVAALRTVRGSHTAEVVPLHNTRESASFGSSGYVDDVAFVKKLCSKGLAELV